MEKEKLIDKKHKTHHEIMIVWGFSLALLGLFTFVFGADAREFAFTFLGVKIFSILSTVVCIICLLICLIWRADPNKDWARYVAIGAAVLYALLIGIPQATYKWDPPALHPKEVKK